MLTRRNLLSAAAALGSTACTRQKASGYGGFAFIANQDGEGVAALDLTAFAVARHIHVDGRPTDVAAPEGGSSVYALTPENGSIHEIRTATLTFVRKHTLAAAAISMRASPDGRAIWVLCRQPRELVRFSLDRFTVEWRCALPEDAADFDIDPTGQMAVISYGEAPLLSLVDLEHRKLGSAVKASGETQTVRFQFDSRAIVAADVRSRVLAIYQTEERRLMVKLPLAVRPDHLCFNADGGQLFITGEGMDAVVLVYPYYTPYVARTVLAGHAPGAMATSLLRNSSPQYLFVANPKSGDVSVLNIRTGLMVAATPVGTDPCCITLTPDDQYALVLNRGSGDVAVIRTANLTRASTGPRRLRKGPLFMMVPVGSKPVSAAVVAI